MIYSPHTKFHVSNEFPVATGTEVTDSGMAYVYVRENGVGKVKVATGAAGETFAGFSSLQTSAATFLPTSWVKVETKSVPTDGVITLEQAPISGSVLITVSSLSTTGTAGASLVVGTLSGLTVVAGTVNAGTSDAAGKVVEVTYRYTLSVLQARSIVGDVMPWGYVGNQLGQVGLGQEGIVYTSCFNSSINWNTATTINLMAGGFVTSGGTGTALKAVVKSVPTESYPYLGLQFRADF